MWDVLKEYPTARIRLEAIATKRLEKYKTDPSPDDKLEGKSKTLKAGMPFVGVNSVAYIIGRY